MADRKLIIHCPGMHPQTCLAGSVPGLSFLLPGIASPGGSSLYYLPPELPLNAKEAERWLSGTLEYFSRFGVKGELSGLGPGVLADHFSESSYSIRGEIKGYGAEKEEADPALKAQMTLLLAWAAEKEVIEAGGLDAGLESSWARFRESLGLEEGEDGEARDAGVSVPDFRTGAFEGEELSWAPQFEAFLVLVPEDAALFVDRRDMQEEWQENGLDFERLPREELSRYHSEWPAELAGELFLLRASGELLAGTRDTGAAGGERTVLCWRPEGGW
jgi:hypothetical protein